jgi:hypothetical protein
MQHHLMPLAYQGLGRREAEAIGRTSNKYAGNWSILSKAAGGLKHDSSAPATFAANKMLVDQVRLNKPRLPEL